MVEVREVVPEISTLQRQSTHLRCQLTHQIVRCDSDLICQSLSSLLARSALVTGTSAASMKTSARCWAAYASWSFEAISLLDPVLSSQKLLNRTSAAPKFLNLERKLSAPSQSLMVLSICNQINRSGLWIESITAAHREAGKNVNLKAAAEWLPAFLSQDFSVTFKLLVKVAPHCGAVYRWLGSIDCQKIYCLRFTSNALFFLISSTVTQCFFFLMSSSLNLSKCWIGFSDTYRNLAVLLYTSWFVAIFDSRWCSSKYLCLTHSQSPEASLFGLIRRSSAEMQIMWCNIFTEHQDESLWTISTQM